MLGLFTLMINWASIDVILESILALNFSFLPKTL